MLVGFRRGVLSAQYLSMPASFKACRFGAVFREVFDCWARHESPDMGTIRPPLCGKPTNIFHGGQLMDDTAYQAFFTQPTQTYHRRYEALRAVFVDGRSQKDVAAEFGFTYGSMRQLIFDFRQYCDAEDEAAESPFFETSIPDVASPVTMKTQIHH